MPRRVVEDKIFAERLKYYRENLGLTKKSLAGLLEISDQLYNRYENKNAQPDLGLLNKMARALKVSVDDLLGYKAEYSDLAKATDILDISGITYEEKPPLFQFTLPEGETIELSAMQLITCVDLTRQQTDERILSPLNSLFITFFQDIFWEAIKKKRYEKEPYNDVQIVYPGNTSAKNFAERLKYYREASGLSQAQLALQLGLKPQTYNRYEKKDAKPSILFLKKVASVLGITVNTLIGGYDPSRFDLALRYLKEIGIPYRTENETVVLVHSLWDELFSDQQMVMDEYEEEPAEEVTLTEGELCYYLNYAWEAAHSKTNDDMDMIFANTFRPLFFDLLKSPPAIDDNHQGNFFMEDYLYQKNLFNKVDRKNFVCSFSGKSEIVDIADIDEYQD